MKVQFEKVHINGGFFGIDLKGEVWLGTQAVRGIQYLTTTDEERAQQKKLEERAKADAERQARQGHQLPVNGTEQEETLLGGLWQGIKKIGKDIANIGSIIANGASSLGDWLKDAFTSDEEKKRIAVAAAMKQFDLDRAVDAANAYFMADTQREVLKDFDTDSRSTTDAKIYALQQAGVNTTMLETIVAAKRKELYMAQAEKQRQQQQGQTEIGYVTDTRLYNKYYVSANDINAGSDSIGKQMWNGLVSGVDAVLTSTSSNAYGMEEPYDTDRNLLDDLSLSENDARKVLNNLTEIASVFNSSPETQNNNTVPTLAQLNTLVDNMMPFNPGVTQNDNMSIGDAQNMWNGFLDNFSLSTDSTVNPTDGQTSTGNSRNDRHVSTLDRRLQQPAIDFLNAARANGINLVITSSYRSIEEQNRLYAIGRPIGSSNRGIVTTVRGGRSYHNYGLAMDVVEVRNGRTIWERGARWNEIGELGKQYGFEWGGDWRRFVDRPHFQMTFGMTTRQLLELSRRQQNR